MKDKSVKQNMNILKKFLKKTKIKKLKKIMK